MEIGLVGLGKMGFNLALNLRDHGYQVVGFDRDQLKAQELDQAGLTGVTSLEKLVTTLKKRRVIWLMVPAGELVDEVITGLLPLLTETETPLRQNLHRALKEAGARHGRRYVMG